MAWLFAGPPVAELSQKRAVLPPLRQVWPQHRPPVEPPGGDAVLSEGLQLRPQVPQGLPQGLPGEPEPWGGVDSRGVGTSLDTADRQPPVTADLTGGQAAHQDPIQGLSQPGLLPGTSTPMGSVKRKNTQTHTAVFSWLSLNGSGQIPGLTK